MTKQEIASALELLHGLNMSYSEVASACGCTVRELEQISQVVFSYRLKHDGTCVLVSRQSKINLPTELADITK